MTLIIPGVEVRVVKDVLAPQLAPSGVLGLIGLCEKDLPPGTYRAASWNSFIETFGAASAYSMPEAAQALSNGVFELVVSPLKNASASVASATLKMKTADSKPKDVLLTLSARAPGNWANGLKVNVKSREAQGEQESQVSVFDLEIQIPGSKDFEVLRNLSAKPDDLRYVVKVVNAESKIAKASAASGASATMTRPALADTISFASGAECNSNDYDAALALLVNEPDVDMVLAVVRSDTVADYTSVYAKVISHCNLMSAKGHGRIGFGEIPGQNLKTSAEAMIAPLTSERFVLLAPAGISGAVAGMVGSLDYFQSPTFKRIAGIADLPANPGVELQQQLLVLNTVPIANQRGRGMIVVRGLTTDGDQISVRRVADRAVRGVKMIGELFIGRLNNEQGRGALKQKLVEFLVQMEKDGAIVPKPDDKDSTAFQVNVYSSQADFAQGIVRVDLAVRPVRAIDYIYATVVVQV